MGDVIYVERAPRLMECAECDGAEFSLCHDGSIRCWNCGGLIKARWVTSNSPPTDAVRADAE